ncbi:MAG: S9 family peptidase [Phycisphaerales bacterium]|nr:S9 family peptidase [Phycisphaerales bacterium]
MRAHLFACLVLLAWPLLTANAQEPAQAHTLAAEQAELQLTSALRISGVSSWGRRPINTDRIVALMVDGTLGEPKPGDPLANADPAAKDTPRWTEASAAINGTFEAPSGSYLLIRVKSEKSRVMMLHASGHSMVYVNGEPRMGDPYSHGYVKLPIQIREGDNQLLFAHAGRGPLSASLVAPPKPVFFSKEDMTLPTVTTKGPPQNLLGGVIIVNATNKWASVLLSSRSADEEPGSSVRERVSLPPCSILKTPVILPASFDHPAVLLTIGDFPDKTLDTAELTLTRATESERRVITFMSAIDGSVQYYAVVPPSSTTKDTKPALVLSLHGASVEATNQAASYAPKPDMYIICPTNRRPFGFDWEDWGRLDALEVLAHASTLFRTDPRRQYLTGHSMGGHGTWHLGVLHPDRFAAIAPSAGWLSFQTYAAARGSTSTLGDDRLMQVFKDAAAASDTIAKLDRLKDRGIYILHGDADDNVPVSEARRARDELTTRNIPFGYHEQPGAGHWWDLPAPEKSPPHTGASCVDWPPIFEMFAKHTLAQPAPQHMPGSTDHLSTGSLKNAFNNRFMLVYGTTGSAEENAWSYAKARFDAEQWWYRGNGMAQVLPDASYLLHRDHRHSDAPLGNVILYGNLDTNAAARALLTDAPMSVNSGVFAAKGRAIRGDDYACLQLHRHTTKNADILVALIGGTGLKGMRATDRLPYFLSGVGIPDMVAMKSTIWTEGPPAVELVGTLTSTNPQFVWRNPEPDPATEKPPAAP